MSLDAAIGHARQMVQQGADVIDVGGQSTRPQSAEYGEGFYQVSLEEELRRVMPLLDALCDQSMKVSIDTTKAEVATQAAKSGVLVVNDISCAQNSKLLRVVADNDLEYVLMHNRRQGERVGSNARYQDVVREVMEELSKQLQKCLAAGIQQHKIWVDPGIGFAKNAQDSLALIVSLSRLRELGCKTMLGASRKSFIAEIVQDGAGPSERIGGSVAVSVLAVQAGVQALRVHDVAQTYQAVRITEVVQKESVDTSSCTRGIS